MVSLSELRRAAQQLRAKAVGESDNLGPDRGTRDQLEARKQRARQQARREAQRERREELIEQAREEERGQVLDDEGGSGGDGGGVVERESPFAAASGVQAELADIERDVTANEERIDALMREERRESRADNNPGGTGGLFGDPFAGGGDRRDDGREGGGGGFLGGVTALPEDPFDDDGRLL